MSTKRRNTSSPECEVSPKKQRPELARDNSSNEVTYTDDEEGEKVSLSERPQLNPETGQSSAFPGLGSDDAAELFYGPANDGIDYLRMVRSEAKGIPPLLVAESVRSRELSIRPDESEDDEEGGYWDDDGTYTAMPGRSTSMQESHIPLAQQYYYGSLLAQFNLVRATMKCIPPLSTIERLTSSQPISFPPESKKARQMWKECLLQKEPSPVQIACMDTSSVFQLLQLITHHLGMLLGTNDLDLVKRFGSWIWAVLGRCPDQGELMSEDVSELRQLAQKAVEIRNRLDGQPKHLRFQVQGEDDATDDRSSQSNDETSNDLSVDIASAKKRLEGRLSTDDNRNSNMLGSITPTQNGQSRDENDFTQTYTQPVKLEKIAILDMIISVIGEFHSQRDLLESRKPWEVLSDGS